MHSTSAEEDALKWAASWAQAPTETAVTGLSTTDITARITVIGAIDGSQVRFHVSNRFGEEPLVVARATVRSLGSAHPVHFAGKPSLVVPPGDEASSDPVVARVAAGSAIDVDLYLPGTQVLTTGNLSVSRWTHSVEGDHCGAADFPAAEPLTMPHPLGGTLPAPTPFLTRVDVLAEREFPVVVCLGDSITAAGWPERAVERLGDRRAAIVNRGIAGNRLRWAGSGPFGGFFGRAGTERFDDDVLATAGGTHVVIALGTNDLGQPGVHAPASELPSADELIQSFEIVAGRARDAGLKVIFATITPFLPAEGYDAMREEIRTTVNGWIRKRPGALFIDFDAALRDEAAPSQLQPAYDSGDHLHPSDVGLDRMAEEAARAIADVMKLR